MHVPAEPLDAPDQRPTSDPDHFVPRFCPHPDCPAHREGAPFRFYRHGHYARLAHPQSIPRFRCRICSRSFSSQTFSTTYYLKRPELLAPVARCLVNGECDRHVRRTVAPNLHYAPHTDVGAAQSSVSRLVPRLGRHAALVLIEAAGTLTEPVVADDFETFARTQLVPIAVPTVVGHKTAYVYALDQAAHCRGGRITPAQQLAVDRLRSAGRLPDPQARAAAWHRVARALCAQVPAGATLHVASDGSTAIAAAFAPRENGVAVNHRTFPNPPRGPKGSPRSREARVRDAALREVDLLHRWFRHSTAHDRRETIAFARCVNALLSRKLLFALSRNFVQPRRERDRGGGTPAMCRGLVDRPLDWSDLLERRRFRARTPPLPPGWAEAYFERIPTLGQTPATRRLPRCHCA
jgi:hypothetical protein